MIERLGRSAENGRSDWWVDTAVQLLLLGDILVRGGRGRGVISFVHARPDLHTEVS